MYRHTSVTRLFQQRVIGIVRTGDRESAYNQAVVLLDAGLQSVEITFTTPGAPEVIASLRDRNGGLVGAGTVLDSHDAVDAIRAGAEFIVSPHLDLDVVRAGHRRGVPVIAGAATAGEIVRALEAGVDAIKLFPAVGMQPRSVADLRAALPQAAIVATGGITVESAPSWLAAGAVAVGMGSALAKGGREQARPRIESLLAAVSA